MSAATLPQSARAAGYRLVVRDEVGSTMEEARRALAEGDDGRLWIVARSQSSGRGRHGRNWGSPPGNLYCTLALVQPCEPALAPQLGFVAGLALHDAAARVTGLAAPRLALKWPNDLLIDGAKASGLLLEGGHAGGRFTVTVGIGVNVASRPDDTPYPAARLADHGASAVEPLFAALAEAWVARFSAWSLPGGFGPTRAAWLERAAFLGETITLRTGAVPLSGRFLGLDPAGRLELDTAEGLRRIDAGDLYAGLPGAGSG